MDFLDGLLGLLAILGIILVAVLIVLVVVDLLLCVIDGRDGVIFKTRKKTEVHERNVEQNFRTEDLYKESKIEDEGEFSFDDAISEMNDEDEKVVDLNKAKEEEAMLNGGVADTTTDFVMEDEVDEDSDKTVVSDVNTRIYSEEDYSKMIKEINEDALKNFAVNASSSDDAVVSKFNENLFSDDEIYGDLDNDDDDDLDFIDDKSDEVEENAVAEEVVEEEPMVQEAGIFEENEKEDDATAEQLAKEQEIREKLEEEVRQLQEELAREREENEKLKQESEQEKAELLTIIAKKEEEEGDGERVPLGNLTDLEDRLEVLRQRLKANEKELRINKKEYVPLARVKRTLESDERKLRRREAMVAKQKVILYGVNNYEDIDEEKAKKLTEDLDLLEGLRLSVAHCEEVMQNNKERFPVLEQTNKILRDTNEQIKQDIADVEAQIGELRQYQNKVDGDLI